MALVMFKFDNWDTWSMIMLFIIFMLDLILTSSLLLCWLWLWLWLIWLSELSMNHMSHHMSQEQQSFLSFKFKFKSHYKLVSHQFNNNNNNNNKSSLILVQLIILILMVSSTQGLLFKFSCIYFLINLINTWLIHFRLLCFYIEFTLNDSEWFMSLSWLTWYKHNYKQINFN